NWDISISKKFSPPYTFGVFNSEVWQDLMTHSKKDSRNYISEFLELDVRAVKSKIADVFSKPRYVVNRLPQGTVVRVLGVEQKGGLVPVEYYTDDTKVDTALMTASFLEKPLHATEPLVEASFSCEGIYGGVEKIICSDVHLGLLDQWLGTYYKQAKFLKPKELKKNQRAWLKERNKVLKIKDPYEQKSTLQHLYQERIQFLDNWRG
ncbi:MAG: lysozyme inhibitor LprI family protein, partial [Flavobacteriaceae bacterium]|nr:lysozyme inhibitor LprI family protein [Flavobacteriaceae bacterium]